MTKIAPARWKSSIKAVNQYLGNDALFPSFGMGQANMNSGRHSLLVRWNCFFPGESALSGDRGLCQGAWKNPATGCGRNGESNREYLNYSNMKIVENGYALRPEILEPLTTLYHFTKIFSPSTRAGDLQWHCEILQNRCGDGASKRCEEREDKSGTGWRSSLKR